MGGSEQLHYEKAVKFASETSEFVSTQPAQTFLEKIRKIGFKKFPRLAISWANLSQFIVTFQTTDINVRRSFLYLARKDTFSVEVKKT